MSLALLFALACASTNTSTVSATDATGPEALARELSAKLAAREVTISDVLREFKALPASEQDAMLTAWRELSFEDSRQREAYRLLQGASAARKHDALAVHDKKAERLTAAATVEPPGEPGRVIGSYFAGLGGLVAYRLLFVLLSSSARNSSDSDGMIAWGIIDLIAAPLAASSLTYVVADGSNHYDVSFGSAYLGALVVEGLARIAAVAIASEGGIDNDAALAFGAVTFAAIPLGATIGVHATKDPKKEEVAFAPFEPETPAVDRWTQKSAALIVPMAFAF
jgi:hypothetical protein